MVEGAGVMKISKEIEEKERKMVELYFDIIEGIDDPNIKELVRNRLGKTIRQVDSLERINQILEKINQVVKKMEGEPTQLITTYDIENVAQHGYDQLKKYLELLQKVEDEKIIEGFSLDVLNLDERDSQNLNEYLINSEVYLNSLIRVVKGIDDYTLKSQVVRTARYVFRHISKKLNEYFNDIENLWETNEMNFYTLIVDNIFRRYEYFVPNAEEVFSRIEFNGENFDSGVVKNVAEFAAEVLLNEY